MMIEDCDTRYQESIIAKYHVPETTMAWYATEVVDEKLHDILFYGLVDIGYEPEWNYFTLEEIIDCGGTLDRDWTLRSEPLPCVDDLLNNREVMI